MQNDILITQMLNTKEMQEMIYLFNKKVRPTPKEE